VTGPGALGVDSPDLTGFTRLARDHRVIPVTRRLLADTLTPVGAFQALAGDRTSTFLLESAESGGRWSRFSIVGVRCAATLTARDGQAHWLGTPPAGVPTGDALSALARTGEHLRSPRLPGLPPLTGGLVGYLGYDVVRRLERLPELAVDDTGVPELAFMFATDLAILDHRDSTVLLVANAVNWDGSGDGIPAAHADAVARLDAMADTLTRAGGDAGRSGIATADLAAPAHYDRDRSPAEHASAIETAKEEIRAGEAFQIVVSQRFRTTSTADALAVYRVLRATNPSPYMYLLRFGDLTGSGVGTDIVGSSPEALVKVEGDRVLTRPIAGTRPRGATPAEDADLERELLADPKERAEHLMLVDLGRNDLGRVCIPGTVEVVEFMDVARYSHVMHLESTVTGQLTPGRTGLDALLACFPAGTLSGAPKPRAMEIIEKLEPTRRGVYGGVIGYLDFAGDVDSAIAIRTGVFRTAADGTIRVDVQAGGGIVADSDPAAEDAETRHKAAAVLRAIAVAETVRPVPAAHV
jgi:anthranilate synthase component 1